MQFSKIVGVLLIPMYIILAFFIFLNLHEIGHTIAARLAGDYTAYYILYERYASGGYAIGRNITNEALLTPLALVIVSLAGPVGTRLLSEVCQWAKRRDWNRPAVLWMALFVFFRLDFAGYVVRNFIGDVIYRQDPSGQDISQPISILSDGNDTLRLALWVLFLVIAVVDIGLDRRRIIAYFRRARPGDRAVLVKSAAQTA